MLHRLVVGSFIVVVGGGIARASSAPSLSQRLVGAWQLLSTEQKLTDGTRRPSPLYGEHGVGYLIYSDAGRMCAVLTDPARARWKAGDSPMPEDLRAIVEHFVAYCGRYEVNEAEAYVVHDVELDVVPNNVGGKLTRYIALRGDTLTLRTAEARPGVVEYTLTWVRVRK